MNPKNTGLRLSSLAIAAVLGFSSCSTEQQANLPFTETVRDVSVLAVKQAKITDVLEAVGTVRALQTSDLATQMMGNIVEMRVHEGDRVNRGQVLAIIDDSQPRAALDRATAADLAARQRMAVPVLYYLSKKGDAPASERLATSPLPCRLAVLGSLAGEV